MTTVKIEGFKEFDAALGELTRAAGKGVLRRAGIKALQPVAEAARSLAPDDPKTAPPYDLKTSITVSSKVKVGRSISRIPEGPLSVNVYMGPTKFGYPQAMIAEFGSDPHINAGMFKGSHHPGTAPQPYMRPAWESGKAKVLDDLKRELWAEIDKAAKRAAKKAAKLAAKG